jgi:hypothetical protein
MRSSGPVLQPTGCLDAPGGETPGVIAAPTVPERGDAAISVEVIPSAWHRPPRRSMETWALMALPGLDERAERAVADVMARGCAAGRVVRVDLDSIVVATELGDRRARAGELPTVGDWVVVHVQEDAVVVGVARRWSDRPAGTPQGARRCFPALTALNLALGDWLGDLATVPRTFVLATIAVPIVIYGVMPHLHRERARLVRRT